MSCRMDGFVHFGISSSAPQDMFGNNLLNCVDPEVSYRPSSALREICSCQNLCRSVESTDTSRYFLCRSLLRFSKAFIML